MARRVGKVSRDWIRKTRREFRDFLNDTGFPDPERDGQRGPAFYYPEWLIMFIAVLSVKCKVKSYVGIHRMVQESWDVVAAGLDLDLISERQLRDRLKKICHTPGKPARFISQLFPGLVESAGRQWG